MKYFNPSYWFKLWVLSAPLFNSKNEGIYAKSIDNQNIKDWASKNTTNISFLENQELNLSNNQTSLLNLPLWNSNLTIHNQHHKHRHQKSRNRLKRQPNINLDVPFIKQEEEFRCGPAIGESILRYFNFIRPNPLWEYQNVLSLEMNTGESRIYSNDSILGTIPNFWQCTINNIIQQNNLNENRIYSLHELSANYVNYSEFFNIVSNSLINNTPVALAYSGNMPGQSEETLDQHFVLIYAINGNHNNPQNANYYYMDPSTGRSGIFDGNDLYDITKGTNYPNNVPMKSYILFYQTQNNLNKKNIINLNSNKYCDINSPVNINKITSIKFLNEYNDDKTLKPGDVIIGTTEGLYFKKYNNNNLFIKALNIDNDEIMIITKFENCQFFVTTKEEDVYFLNTKFVNEGNFFGQIISNAKSSNLEKELILYLRSDHKNEDINFAYNEKNYNYFLLDLFLGKINPLTYKKIEFLGDNFHWTRISWGKKPYYSDKKVNDYSHINFDDLAENRKIENNQDIETYANNYIQWIREYSAGAVLRGQQYFGITWHWEKNYYLQFFVKQYAQHWTGTGGGVWMGIGNRIRLYNDNVNDIKTQISNSNDRKRRKIFEEKNELQNTTQWDKNITNFINHEQHLPIDNKTNFVTNNITSL